MLARPINLLFWYCIKDNVVLQAFHPPSGFLRTNSESIGNELPVSEYLLILFISEILSLLLSSFIFNFRFVTSPWLKHFIDFECLFIIYPHIMFVHVFNISRGLTLFEIFFTTVLKSFVKGSWNFVTFNINLWNIRNSYVYLPRLCGVTIAMGLLRSNRNFLKLLFHMFPLTKYIFKVFKSKIWLDIWNKHPKILSNTKFQLNQWRGLGVTGIWNLGLCVG